MHLFHGPLMFPLVLKKINLKKLLNVRFLVKILTCMLSMINSVFQDPIKISTKLYNLG